MLGRRKVRLGEMLFNSGKVTEEQIEEANEYAKERRVRIGRAFIDLGFLDEDELLEELSKQMKVPMKKMSEVDVKEETLSLFSEEVIKYYRFFPFDKNENSLSVLVEDTLDVVLDDYVYEKTGLMVEKYLISGKELNRMIAQRFDTKKVMDDLEDLGSEDLSEDFFNLGKDGEDSPIIKITDSIFQEAVSEGVSDIHIGPEENRVVVRFRLDGILHEYKELPKAAHAAFTSRIKLMGGMDITETRKPQDGRIQIKADSKMIDMRVSTLPTVNGEKITIRLLDKSSLILSLEQLGFSEEKYEEFKNLIESPVGIVLVTGPTGSGKSTTLYTVISEISDVSKNFITVEDPVEYRMDGIVQVQVNEKSGLTFEASLRSILRQDPDVILIGEIRDVDTAKIAAKASNTGHLVFATLHTNDAISSVTRLVEMGLEPYEVASTVMGVVNQRLIRKVCKHCKKSYVSKETNRDRIFFGIPEGEEIELVKGEGCEECNHTGYKGRIAIQELLIMNEEVRRLLLSNAYKTDIEEAAKRGGMVSLKMDGLEKAKKGLTTLEEVRRFVVL